jgi:hypothetical protein
MGQTSAELCAFRVHTGSELAVTGAHDRRHVRALDQAVLARDGVHDRRQVQTQRSSAANRSTAAWNSRADRRHSQGFTQ